EHTADTAVAHDTIGRNFWETARKLFNIPTYWVLLGALTFSFCTIGGTSFWLTTYLTRDFSLSLTEAGSISGIVLIVSGLSGTVLGGWLADFLQRHRPEGRMITSVF